MPTQQKKELVAQLTKRLQQAQAIYLTDYQGLSHPQLEQLRQKIKAHDADYTIVKNTLFKLALQQTRRITSVTEAEMQITGPTAILFAYRDPIKPLQIFAEQFQQRLKAAFAFGQYLHGSALQRLVNLKSETALQAKLAAQLANPLSRLGRALNWNLRKLTVVLTAIKQQANKTN